MRSARQIGPRSRRVARRLLASTDAKRIVISHDDAVWADVGDVTATFPATRSLVAGGTPIADLQVSAERAQNYARLVTRTTRMETIVRRNGRVIASTVARPGAVALPEHTGEVTIADRRFRAATFTTAGFLGERIQVSILEPTATTEHDIRQGRLVAGLVLLGFFLLALVSAIVVSRSLNRQIEDFLSRRATARRGRLLGRGRHPRPRPVRAARRGVQQDVAPARRPPGGAWAGAVADGVVTAPDW